MTWSAAAVQNLEYKLQKRGFGRDPYPINCEKCEERAVLIYSLKHTNLGGRTIEWCHHCHDVRSYSRDSDGERIEQPHFDLEQFLG